MKNVFSKTNVPYLVSGALATATLLASGVFAVAPYVGFLAPAAALSVGLPFIVGGAVFSVLAIALSAVAISKNKTISQQEKFENRVVQRKAGEAKARTDVIALPYKDAETPNQETGTSFDNLDLASSSKQGKQANGLDYSDFATSKNLNHLDVKILSPESQPAKEENGQSWTA